MRMKVATAIDRFGRVIEWVVVLLTALLVIIVTANVFMRYVLQIGLLWAEEVSRITFVWIVFLGAFLALRRRAHLALTFVYDRFPSRLRTAVGYLGMLLVLAFLCVIAYQGVELVKQTLRFGRVTPILGVSAAWGYLSVPVGATLMALEMVRQLLTAGSKPHPVTSQDVDQDGVSPTGARGGTTTAVTD